LREEVMVARRAFLKIFGATVAAVAVSSILSYQYLIKPMVTQTESKQVTVTDVLGRIVTLPYPVKTCVVTDDNVAEPVQLIGVADRVIGIEGSIPERGYFPEMSDKPIIGNQWRGLNYELIAELKPDVVIMLPIARPEET
jgi:iron complex transport system substrate-binding protein